MILKFFLKLRLTQVADSRAVSHFDCSRRLVQVFLIVQIVSAILEIRIKHAIHVFFSVKF